MSVGTRLVGFGLCAALVCGVPVFLSAQTISSAILGNLTPRAVGPATCSGRVTAIEAVYVPVDSLHPKDRRLVIYVGSAAGGVFKSKDGGVTFEPIFDKQECLSIGALALDPRYRDSVLWVGTGESNVRNSVSIGCGLYCTRDGGQTWKKVGLDSVERIARIALDRKNPDRIYVAALGALWSDSPHRGLYRSTNGGKTFERILYVDEKTGCADVAVDPANPQIIYAAMWQFRRKAYTFSSGGPGSGLYKSTDGGKTWRKLTKGLPSGELGRIVLAIAPSKPSVVYAMVEAKESALYRSTDRGETWERRSSAVNVTARPFYFAEMVVDPYDPNRVYRLTFQLAISDDGGATFNSFSYGGALHPDHHALWIDPTNPQHLLIGTDGGVYESFDRGQSWRMFRNLPLAQFYRISYDFDDPYNIMGGLQDNGSWMAPHRVRGGAITNCDWQSTGWGDGFAVVRDRIRPEFIYFESQGGEAVRRNIRTNETRSIQPRAGVNEPKLRFNWNTPIIISAANPRYLYIGSQYLHRSTDHGTTWQRISPDLTTNDSTKYDPQESGGITRDNTSAENHCTIYTIADSPLDEQVIWVGTDDGNLQRTTDGGLTWTNLRERLPASLPEGTWVSCVEPSPHDRNTCFVAFDNHTRGDMRPYVYRTTDLGNTWQRLSTDSVRGFVHVVRQDPVNPDLLFVGTELGLYFSLDGGQHFVRFKGIPATPVRDIQIHPRTHDLIVATHGRGAYILDDLTPLRGLKPSMLDSPLIVLPVRPTVQRFESGFQEFSGSDEYVAPSPSNDAMIAYYLPRRHLIGEIAVEVLDSTGKSIATLPPGRRKGINRLGWGMRMNPPRVARSLNPGGGSFGPLVPPGTYMVRVKSGNHVATTTLVILPDSSSGISLAERQANFAALMRLYTLIEETAFAVEQILSLREAIDTCLQQVSSSLASSLRARAATLDSVYHSLVAAKASLFADTEPKLREKLADLYGAIASYPGLPTEEQLQLIDQYASHIAGVQQWIARFMVESIEPLNSALQQHGLQPLRLLSRTEFDAQTAY
ncbi:MAG: glycosyl hydrolase [Bacteroidota bacterium]|nr:glycosyl hydrolase [Candidatus Kapabacteria bacterium]MDW8074896.1 glycosyl hydrolase [Bacteroidota bacterium]